MTSQDRVSERKWRMLERGTHASQRARQQQIRSNCVGANPAVVNDSCNDVASRDKGVPSSTKESVNLFKLPPIAPRPTNPTENDEHRVGLDVVVGDELYAGQLHTKLGPSALELQRRRRHRRRVELTFQQDMSRLRRV
eukprot:SAG31_NODE_5977_length_2229_cov_1.861502_2_plen_138_part_00